MQPSQTDSDLDAGYVIEISESQIPLRSYIWKFVGNRHDTDDILQNTNIILWEKRMDWDPETVFLKWAYRIAYFQVKAHFRDRGREQKRLRFDDSLLDLLAHDEPHMFSSTKLFEALDTCLGKMETTKRELLVRRYEGSTSVEDLAKEKGYSANTLSQILRRMRSRLSDCIQLQLNTST
ncbi:sigma-70 family RNA polymerase sigma factor [Rubellicoccus peritrichatus]|uniref:Sigma-70 family RNA polymerase sigma factor n=1 Tax=Rubellicoccus peritrichatus TaxID=3080537 RepID=A0AAQ3L7N4_9BACT|nr:sigma-70 family RNA polymerase sigma factor [Puniceicoccus sp. CR14]WOO39382.1 sigma-70 family RNA polymerase sigma factor [Puniceicoccus sp. CR14]